MVSPSRASRFTNSDPNSWTTAGSHHEKKNGETVDEYGLAGRFPFTGVVFVLAHRMKRNTGKPKSQIQPYMDRRADRETRQALRGGDRGVPINARKGRRARAGDAARCVSIVEDDTEGGGSNHELPVGVNEPQLAELGHEEVDSRPGRPDHLGQRFLPNGGQHPSVPIGATEPRHQHQCARETPLGRVEESIDEVFFDADTSSQNVGDEALVPTIASSPRDDTTESLTRPAWVYMTVDAGSPWR
jgi:hypothetical protein